MNLALREEFFRAKVLRHAASFWRFFSPLFSPTCHISLSTQTSKEEKKRAPSFALISPSWPSSFVFFFSLPPLHLSQSNDERQPNSASILVFRFPKGRVAALLPVSRRLRRHRMPLSLLFSLLFSSSSSYSDHFLLGWLLLVNFHCTSCASQSTTGVQAIDSSILLRLYGAVKKEKKKRASVIGQWSFTLKVQLL